MIPKEDHVSKDRIIEMLNKLRTAELVAIIQYMGHHYEGQGMESPAIVDMVKDVAIDEMKHAEKLGERIAYLGGIPTYQVPAGTRGGDLRKMLQDDLNLENAGIANYKSGIKVCIELDDPTSRVMLEGILAEEEGHADTFESALGIR